MSGRKGLLSRLLPDGSLAEQGKPSCDLRIAWRRGDEAIERDAIAFWNRLAILPPGVAPATRARELAVAAYAGDTLVGVTTASLGRIEWLRGRFAFLRCAVDPAHRRGRLAMALTIQTRDIIEAWAAEHPEERLLGLAGVVETPLLQDRLREPVWPTTRFTLVGHRADGRQVRVAWFEHARLD